MPAHSTPADANPHPRACPRACALTCARPAPSAAYFGPIWSGASPTVIDITRASPVVCDLADVDLGTATDPTRGAGPGRRKGRRCVPYYALGIQREKRARPLPVRSGVDLAPNGGHLP